MATLSAESVVEAISNAALKVSLKGKQHKVILNFANRKKCVCEPSNQQWKFP